MGKKSPVIGDLADDGKRSPALDVAFRAGGSSEGRESEGGKWVSHLPGAEDLADDGKRFDALDVAC